MEPQHRPVSDAGKLSLHFCSGPRKTRGVRGVKSLESGPPFGTLESAFHPRHVFGSFWRVPKGTRPTGGTVSVPAGETLQDRKGSALSTSSPPAAG